MRVLDLEELFERAKPDGAPLYCKRDTHWSPRACEIVAAHIADELGGRFPAVTRRDYARESHTIEVVGDLERRLASAEETKETLLVSRVKEGANPVQAWRESPLLLLGDSHTLVFHTGGDMLARGAGLLDQLAFELGFPPDLVGVRGSGSTAARISLFRRGDELAGKEVVLWVFAARELTQSMEGWRKVPVIR